MLWRQAVPRLKGEPKGRMTLEEGLESIGLEDFNTNPNGERPEPTDDGEMHETYEMAIDERGKDAVIETLETLLEERRDG